MDSSSSTVEASSAAEPARVAGDTENVEYRAFYEESDLSIIMDLVDVELSEPYSIFTYRYFINQWPDLCYLVRSSFPSVRQQLSSVHTPGMSAYVVRIPELVDGIDGIFTVKSN